MKLFQVKLFSYVLLPTSKWLRFGQGLAYSSSLPYLHYSFYLAIVEISQSTEICGLDKIIYANKIFAVDKVIFLRIYLYYTYLGKVQFYVLLLFNGSGSSKTRLILFSLILAALMGWMWCPKGRWMESICWSYWQCWS